jgi:hypothetical protein
MNSAVLSTVLGALLALLGGIVGTWYAARRRERDERRSLAGAFAGEIQAVVDILERRQYVEGIEALIAEVESSGRPTAVFGRIRGRYFQVYEANAARIGVLRAPLPEKIARFYTQANAFLEDIRDPSEAERLDLSCQESLDLLTEMRELLQELLQTGKECVELARKHANH